jgi:phthiodiolone/phenolphthiodiolone dimycocerosates ketoreductase
MTQRLPILGLGAGERLSTDPYGLDSLAPFDFGGEHFRLQGAVLDLPTPDGRTLEVWVAAHGPRMLRLTGQNGEGWYPVFVASPDDYAARLEVSRAAAQAVGRDPDAITPALLTPIIVAPTEEEARAMLDAKATRCGGRR